MAVLTFTTRPGDDQRRLDECILREMPELGTIGVRTVFQHRDVKLDGVRVRNNTRVRPGQRVDVYYMEDLARNRTLDIVYEDGDVLLVNKQAGISVETDDGGGVSLTDLAFQYVRGKDPSAPSPIPCHRLDHQTCGLLLMARTPAAAEVLRQVFLSRSLDKRYTCLVRGVPKPPRAECAAYLIKHAEEARVEILDHPCPGAVQILTGYETLETEGPLSRLRVHLITGRTHQIRAHLSALGHPILGDDVYGDRSFNRIMKSQGRLKLCASELTLDTGGALPRLDHHPFTIPVPF